MSAREWMHSHPLITVAIIGIAIRLVLAPILSHTYDVSSWAVVIENFRAGEGLYDVDGYYYPPIWGYFLGFFKWILEIVPGMDVISLRPAVDFTHIFPYNDTRIPTVAFAVAVKIPLFIIDLGVAYLLYRLVFDITGDERKAIMSFAIWMVIAPAVLASAVKGMFDNLSVLLLLLSMWFLKRRNYIVSGTLLSAACMTKIYPGIALFAMLVYILDLEKDRSDRIRAYAGFLGAAGATIIVILLPAIISGDLEEVFHFLIYRLNDNGGSASITMSGLKILALLAGVIVVSLLIPGILKRAGVESFQTMVTSVALTIGASLVYYYQQQYLIEVLPLFIILMTAYGNRIKWPLVALSALFVFRLMDELPAMLLPLAECTGIVDTGTLSGIAHFLTYDSAGTALMWFITVLSDALIHVMLAVIVLIILVSAVPALRNRVPPRFRIIFETENTVFDR